MQIEYEGRKRVSSDHTGLEETVIDTKKSFQVEKGAQSFRIENLLSNTLYSINISAKFIDGITGPPYQLRVETSPSGYTFVYIVVNLVFWKLIKFTTI